MSVLNSSLTWATGEDISQTTKTCHSRLGPKWCDHRGIQQTQSLARLSLIWELNFASL
jgi:hypothetical protein